MEFQRYFFAKSSFALYEPGIDFIQGTDLILEDDFRNEISIAGM